MYQDVNLLTPKRKNSFCADGTSTDYVLDATNIDSVDKVIVKIVVLVQLLINWLILFIVIMTQIRKKFVFV